MGRRSFTLILGHAQHGKDTFADALAREYRKLAGEDFYAPSSSLFACERAVLPVLGPRYGYRSVAEAYADRHAHRSEWFDLISEYNREDPARLVRDMLDAGARAYVGLRSWREYSACLRAGFMTHVVWVYRAGAPTEPESSFDVDFHDARDIARARGVEFENALNITGRREVLERDAALLARQLHDFEQRDLGLSPIDKPVQDDAAPVDPSA